MFEMLVPRFPKLLSSHFAARPGPTPALSLALYMTVQLLDFTRGHGYSTCSSKMIVAFASLSSNGPTNQYDFFRLRNLNPLRQVFLAGTAVSSGYDNQYCCYFCG
jgi:hypothetical protein